MTKQERTFNRDLTYSLWHRHKCPQWCYATDLDWLEVRSNADGSLRIAAIIETKHMGEGITQFQIKVFTTLSRLTGIPFYLVRFDTELENFVVTEYKQENGDDQITGYTCDVQSEEEYLEWLRNL